jgi:putative glutamine amidotransferase
MPEKNPQRIAISFGDRQKLSPYERAVRTVGLEPVLNPESLEGVSGLLLAGGTDIDPELYGQQKHPQAQKPDRARDLREFRLIQQAIERDIPVLAICRGLQMLNITLGGTLIQHLPNTDRHMHRTTDPSERIHEITVPSDSLLAAVIGAGQHGVNSRHHQAIDQLAPSLRATATSAEDGIIEAAELFDKTYIVGVQWHPEDRILCEPDRKIFESFARAVLGSAVAAR